MWISKAEYEELSSTAAENEHDAKMYREIFKLSNKNDIRIYHDFVIVGYDYFRDLLTKQSAEEKAEEDEVKDLQAELEWYKVKYHEMKMKVEDRL
jgi:hypothetical protein